MFGTTNFSLNWTYYLINVFITNNLDLNFDYRAVRWRPNDKITEMTDKQKQLHLQQGSGLVIFVTRHLSDKNIFKPKFKN